MKRNKVFSALAPSEFGGGDATHGEICAFVRVLAPYFPSTALAVAASKSLMIHSLKEKVLSRDLPVEKTSMRNPEIIRRSQKEYALLENEIEGPLPDFDETYKFVREFYDSLSWD